MQCNLKHWLNAIHLKYNKTKIKVKIYFTLAILFLNKTKKLAYMKINCFKIVNILNYVLVFCFENTL